MLTELSLQCLAKSFFYFSFFQTLKDIEKFLFLWPCWNIWRKKSCFESSKTCFTITAKRHFKLSQFLIVNTCTIFFLSCICWVNIYKCYKKFQKCYFELWVFEWGGGCWVVGMEFLKVVSSWGVRLGFDGRVFVLGFVGGSWARIWVARSYVCFENCLQLTKSFAYSLSIISKIFGGY